MYNMSGHVVLDDNVRVKEEYFLYLYVWYNTEANVVYNVLNENICGHLYSERLLKQRKRSIYIEYYLYANIQMFLSFLLFFFSWIITESDISQQIWCWNLWLNRNQVPYPT